MESEEDRIYISGEERVGNKEIDKIGRARKRGCLKREEDDMEREAYRMGRQREIGRDEEEDGAERGRSMRRESGTERGKYMKGEREDESIRKVTG